MLKLPKGAKIVRINPPDYRFFDRRELEIVVEHDELEDIAEGKMMPIRAWLYDSNSDEGRWA
jgi:hypothetical protein